MAPEARHEITNLVEAYDYNALSNIEGIEVHEIIDGAGDRFRGGEYVFGYVLQEPWASTKEGLPREFWRNAKGFLAEHDYFIVEGEPRAGDIVGYALDDLYSLCPTSAEVANDMMSRRSSPYFEHFGLLTDDGRVLSKFSTGPVLNHDLDKIPTHWGSSAYFFRKQPKNVYVRERDWDVWVEEVQYDPNRRVVTTGWRLGSEIRNLEENEVQLLDFLAVNQNRTIGWEEIRDAIGPGLSRATIAKRVNQLRRKVETPGNIATVRGEGYEVCGIIVKSISPK